MLGTSAKPNDRGRGQQLQRTAERNSTIRGLRSVKELCWTAFPSHCSIHVWSNSTPFFLYVHPSLSTRRMQLLISRPPPAQSSVLSPQTSVVRPQSSDDGLPPLRPGARYSGRWEMGVSTIWWALGRDPLCSPGTTVQYCI